MEQLSVYIARRLSRRDRAVGRYREVRVSPGARVYDSLPDTGAYSVKRCRPNGGMDQHRANSRCDWTDARASASMSNREQWRHLINEAQLAEELAVHRQQRSRRGPAPAASRRLGGVNVESGRSKSMPRSESQPLLFTLADSSGEDHQVASAGCVTGPGPEARRYLRDPSDVQPHAYWRINAPGQ